MQSGEDRGSSRAACGEQEVDAEHRREDERAEVVRGAGRRQGEEQTRERPPRERFARPFARPPRDHPEPGRQQDALDERLEDDIGGHARGERIRIEIGLAHEDAAQEHRRRAVAEVVRVRALARQRAGQYRQRVDAKRLEAKERDGPGREDSHAGAQACERAPPALEQKEDGERRGINLEHGGQGQRRAGARVSPRSVERRRGGEQEEEKHVLLAELEVGPEGDDRGERDERHAPRGHAAHGAQQAKGPREEDQIHAEPASLGRERREGRQRHEHERRERRQ